LRLGRVSFTLPGSKAFGRGHWNIRLNRRGQEIERSIHDGAGWFPLGLRPAALSVSIARTFTTPVALSVSIARTLAIAVTRALAFTVANTLAFTVARALAIAVTGAITVCIAWAVPVARSVSAVTSSADGLRRRLYVGRQLAASRRSCFFVHIFPRPEEGVEDARENTLALGVCEQSSRDRDVARARTVFEGAFEQADPIDLLPGLALTARGQRALDRRNLVLEPQVVKTPQLLWADQGDRAAGATCAPSAAGAVHVDGA
jgi:hypothetical protein